MKNILFPGPLIKVNKEFIPRNPNRLEALIEGQGEVLQMIKEGAPLSTILDAIIHWVENQSQEELLASILIYDKNQNCLLHGSAPSLPEPYNKAIHGIKIGPTVGSCGTAASTKKTVIVSDIENDPLWKDFKSLALQFGLRACWSTPLLSREGEVLGTFAIYYKKVKKPSPDDMQIIRLVNHTTTIAIDYKSAEQERELRQKKEAEIHQKVLEERQHFYSILMNTPAMMAVLRGPEHIFDLANSLYLKAVGNDRNILGKPIADALPELKNQGIFELLDNVYSSGIPFIGNEIPVKLDKKSDGNLEIAYFNFIYQPITNHQNEVEGILVHAVDVTQTVCAKQNLIIAEEKLRLALDSASLATWSYNPESNILHLGPRLKEWLGYNEDNIHLIEFLNCINVQYRGKVEEKLQQFLKSNGSPNFEDEFEITNLFTGEKKILKSQGILARNLMDDPDKPGIVGCCRDITKEKLNELELESQVLQRTQDLEKVVTEMREMNIDLERVNQNLEQFAYVASHDLQEPLRKIRIYSDYLLTKHLHELSGSGRDYMNRIATSVDRMSSLIRDLLSFSRLEKMQEDFQKKDLNCVIAQVKEDFELLIREKKANIKIDKLPEIECIHLQMRQLFYNLIGNSLKFSKDNTPPVINIQSEKIDKQKISEFKNLDPNKEYYRISVEDNGIGFDQKFAEQIFIIFQKLHTRDKYEGTGIGLALCKKVVNNHAGEIYAESSPGKGSVFHIILPSQQNK